MSDDKQVNKGRRNLVIATCAAGGAAGVAAAVPFAASWLPSERAKAAGAPVVADISTLEPGQMMTVEWRGKPVWIIRRTKEMLDDLPNKIDKLVSIPIPTCRSSRSTRRTNTARSSRKYWCWWASAPTWAARRRNSNRQTTRRRWAPDWTGGFLCPCHGSKFDLAGRVYKGKPAPENLEVPKYTYLSDTRILIGEDTKGA